MKIEGKIIRILQEKDATAEDISKELDIDKESIETVLKRLKAEGFLVEV